MKTKLSGILTLFLALVVQISFAQKKTVSGTVSNESGVLPGVSVLVKGTNIGSKSNFDGKYTIQANTGNILFFRYLGYKLVEKKVTTSNTINILLEQDASVLDEIIVTALGIKAKPRSLTYAVETVSGESLDKARETNLVSSLNGKAAGVQVTTSSGSAGASANIRIRGNTSITRSNGPLFVVDGVPINNGSASEAAGSA